MSAHSPDVSSPQYPDRPIRPLPKRRLRSRLSPEQERLIVFPPAPASSTNTAFGPPYSPFDKLPSTRPRFADEHTCNCGGQHSELDSEDDEEERIRAAQSSPTLIHFTRNLLGVRGGNTGKVLPKPPPPGSGSSSADGYESFENTNNKKKRKIPVCATTANHPAALSTELANMGISSQTRGKSPDEERSGSSQYYGSGTSAQAAYGSTSSSGTGISGAGRGRYGRPSPRASIERRSTGTNTNMPNGHVAGSSTAARARRDWGAASGINGKGMSSG